MKSKILLITSILTVCMYTACNSGSSSKGGKDTAQSHYDAPSNMDTSKTTTTTGSSSVIDNSGSGGHNTVKDTLNKANAGSTKK